MTTCAWASNVALSCLKTETHEYNRLSAEMCWDATFHVALLAGVIDQAKYTYLKTEAGQRSALAGGQRIHTADEMRAVPAGYFIYFMYGVKRVHAMLSTGGGKATGNKNNCIGVGKIVGWEQLDLAGELDWGGTADIRIPPYMSAEKRDAGVFCYPVTELALR